MQKQFLWAVVMVVIIGGGYFLWASSRSSTPTPASAQPEGTLSEEGSESSAAKANEVPGTTATVNVGATAGTNAPMSASVTYDGASFSPSSVTIKKGGTVTFTSTSGSMWVASNPHPTHTDYPGFDERSTNTTYSFTFDKVGAWGYHNHRNPGVGGMVNVVE